MKGFSAAGTSPAVSALPCSKGCPMLPSCACAPGCCLGHALGEICCTSPHGEKGRRTPSSWTERETDPVLPSSDTHAALSCYRHLPEKKTPNSALSPHAMEGDWGCAPVRAGPTAQTSGSKRECGAGAQGTASDRVLFLYLLAAGQYVQYLRFLERKRKQKTLIVVPSKSCGDRLCCRHRRLP